MKQNKNINKNMKKQAVNLECIRLWLSIQYATSVRVLTYKTVSNIAHNTINVNKL